MTHRDRPRDRRRLPKDAGLARRDGAPVPDDARGEVDRDQRESGPPRTVRYLPACGDRSIAGSVRAGPGLDRRPASATAKTSMTERIGKSEAVRQAKCAKPPVNHAWIAGFVAINCP